MVMQMAYLFPGTVAGNIAFAPLQRHETMSQEQIEALLDRVGLPGYQGRDVSTLSGGRGATRVVSAHPGELSGGVAVGRADLRPR
jgi:ABC-type nitrate/sulfonate/bicarbonate transport system ATPase subunit